MMKVSMMYKVAVVYHQNDKRQKFGKSKRKHNGTYDRMLGLAARALLEVTCSSRNTFYVITLSLLFIL